MYPAPNTEYLYNILNDPNAKAKIDEAMSTYPLYEKQTEDNKIPIYIPTREELNNKILSYYKYREIAFETVGRFIEELKNSLEEIMPYYNQLYFSIDQEYEIKYNADYTRTTSSNNTTDSKDVTSDTPQDEIDLPASDIDDVSYANEINWNKGNSSGTTTERLTGNYGMTTTQSLISQYRDLIINVEQQIINNERISELFLRIY